MKNENEQAQAKAREEEQERFLAEKYWQAAGCFPAHWKEKLLAVPADLWGSVQEIRLQEGRPILLFTNAGVIFGEEEQQISAEELEACFRHFCGYSVHTHEAEIEQGFVCVEGGHRVGIGGTAVYQGDRLSGMREISSLNFRIARAIPGASAALLRPLFGDGPCSVLLAGPPSSGKTTVLRDLAKEISSGGLGRCYKVTVIDERFEIGGCKRKAPLGFCCDLLSGFGKAAGMVQAIRTLSPEFIICDEVSTTNEVEAIEDGLNSGVNMILSLHANSISQLKQKPQFKRLLASGSFQKLALLEGASRPGYIKGIYNLADGVLD